LSDLVVTVVICLAGVVVSTTLTRRLFARRIAARDEALAR
jgi:hypothetical protein